MLDTLNKVTAKTTYLLLVDSMHVQLTMMEVIVAASDVISIVPPDTDTGGVLNKLEDFHHVLRCEYRKCILHFTEIL